jgi:hypothetical protein
MYASAEPSRHARERQPQALSGQAQLSVPVRSSDVVACWNGHCTHIRSEQNLGTPRSRITSSPSCAATSPTSPSNSYTPCAQQHARCLSFLACCMPLIIIRMLLRSVTVKHAEELQPLAKKDGATMCFALKQVIDRLRETLQLPGETPMLHILIGDGIYTNEKAARQLFALLRAENRNYCMVSLKCSSHQANLTACSLVAKRYPTGTPHLRWRSDGVDSPPAHPTSGGGRTGETASPPAGAPHLRWRSAGGWAPRKELNHEQRATCRRGRRRVRSALPSWATTRETRAAGTEHNHRRVICCCRHRCCRHRRAVAAAAIAELSPLLSRFCGHVCQGQQTTVHLREVLQVFVSRLH